MKLSEAIDLFRRRLYFHLEEDPVRYACATLDGNEVTYYINMESSITDEQLQRYKEIYTRLFKDTPNVTLKLIPNRKWRPLSNAHQIWVKKS